MENRRSSQELIGLYFGLNLVNLTALTELKVVCNDSNEHSASDPDLRADSLDTIYVTFKIIMNVYVVGGLCLFGFIGNILSIIVLRCANDNSNTTTWLLRTLAVVDIFYLITCVFVQLLKTVNDHTPGFPALRRAFPYMEPYCWGLASFAQTITIWTILLVTLDRFIAVCQPLSSKMRHLSRAKLAFAVLLLAAVLYNIPSFLELTTVHSTDPCTGEVHLRTAKTTFRRSKVYFVVYKTVCFFFFRSIGPLVVIVVLNSKLIHALHVVNQRQRQLRRKPRSRENLTLMLVAVVSVFVVCELPDFGLRLAITFKEYADAGVIHDVEWMQYANVVTNVLLTFNSCANFLIYCLIGKKFRTILLTRLQPCSNRPFIDVENSHTEVRISAAAGARRPSAAAAEADDNPCRNEKATPVRHFATYVELEP